MKMKSSMVKYIALSLIMAFVIVGCAKPPVEETNAASAAIEAAKQDGAEKYSAEELKSVSDELAAAADEVKVQENKFFKNYDKAKQILAKVKGDAEAIKAGIPAKKEEAKNGAVAAQTAATTAITDAKALLEKAPKGKDSKAEVEALTNDIKGLEESLPGVQQMIDTEDYFGAADKAKAISEKATSVSDQINAAIEKKGGKKK
ncbi:MAG: hypothetical protein HZA77_04470 [Candidatus Schekmanbacteria bacterium]|nr:hypothetical protein [Candidatus Schekmanbacteria bacterium]